ncbi:Lsr2 family protein [Rhodococcus sp. H29-C3]|uniref:histone-like nucleoid-structuring protein Lsr2 n=1 Tax=Rhodococcus sp. H29-C3 TaxID=3046307 RepID=UPI0024B9A4F3|nr:Lsr2 family protein [Rhodococcus sp. H29-C3]MDJ0362210.1 Lsr2 family protein [Rhodococcus sp. H29-C3]
MAKKVFTQLVDDIDGTVIDDESGESIEFSVNGVDYLVDLKAKNASEFHRKIGYYIEHGTRVGGRKRRNSPTPAASPAAAPSSTGATRDPAQTRAIRQWAADNGYEISDRGRIPTAIEDAFTAAH